MRAAKLAFVHTSKAAGRYTNHYLITRVFDNDSDAIACQRVKVFNSWYRPFMLARDWQEDELLAIAGNHHPAQTPSPAEVVEHHRRFAHDYLARQFVHNHHRFWTRRSVQAFQERGWLVFTFLREPADRLCSLWTWARREAAAGADPRTLLTPTRLLALSLDDFLREAVTKPELKHLRAVPDYLDRLDYVAEFNRANFAAFLSTAFGHDYAPETVGGECQRASGNPGYRAYRQRGEVSDVTAGLLDSSEDIQRLRALIAGPPRVSGRFMALA